MEAPLVQLFVNPQAGSYAPGSVARLRKDLERCGKSVVVTDRFPFALAAPKVDEVVVVGGDGTLRHVVGVLMAVGADVTVRVVHGGTANLLDREMAEAQAEAGAGAGAVRRHYMATANGDAMLVCLSIGPDARIVASVSSRLKRWIGALAYGVAGVRCLQHWRRETLLVRVDGAAAWRCAALYVLKGRYYAGPWSIAPEARVTEPLLWGVALLSDRRRDYAAFLLGRMLRRPMRGGKIRRFVCREVEVQAEGEGRVPVQVDGDTAGMLPTVVRLCPRPMRFVRGL